MTTQACTPIARNRVLYGSANWSWEFTLWQTVELPVIWEAITFMWRHYYAMDILSLWHTDALLSRPYDIPLCPYEIILIPYLWLNQIRIISLQWLYMSTITSHITGDTTVCSNTSAAWQQRNSQSSTYSLFLRVIHRWQVNSLHKGRVMRKVFPCHDVIIRT